MASITVRNLDESLKAKLKLRAARYGRSMEEEVRVILSLALAEEASLKNLGERIHQRFLAVGGVNCRKWSGNQFENLLLGHFTNSTYYSMAESVIVVMTNAFL